jgi:hypothetical protein
MNMLHCSIVDVPGGRRCARPARGRSGVRPQAGRGSGSGVYGRSEDRAGRRGGAEGGSGMAQGVHAVVLSEAAGGRGGAARAACAAPRAHAVGAVMGGCGGGGRLGGFVRRAAIGAGGRLVVVVVGQVARAPVVAVMGMRRRIRAGRPRGRQQRSAQRQQGQRGGQPQAQQSSNARVQCVRPGSLENWTRSKD